MTALKQDIVTEFHGAKIQHGPLNQRIYLMDLNGASPSTVVPRLEQMAAENRYTKIFAKVPESQAETFYRAGYRQEASVPRFFNGREDAVFLGLYLQEARRTAPNKSDIDRVIETARKKQLEGGVKPSRPAGLEIRVCDEGDAEAMSRLYGEVFQSYPFPIQNPGYLKETMQSHVVYFCARNAGQIVALSSAEMDAKNENVEMTDFATHPRWRGRRLATCLLSHMEDEMCRRGILTAYTISRAASFAINVTFSSMGYAYGGLLVNNTNISGQIESMVVWHKQL